MSRAVFPMAEIINLNKARKARARVDAKADAAANRAAHGRTKAERNKTKLVQDQLDQVLDGARRDRTDDDERA